MNVNKNTITIVVVLSVALIAIFGIYSYQKNKRMQEEQKQIDNQKLTPQSNSTAESILGLIAGLAGVLAGSGLFKGKGLTQADKDNCGGSGRWNAQTQTCGPL